MSTAGGEIPVLIELSKEIVELVGDGLAQRVVIGGPEHAADIASAEPDRAARPIVAIAAASSASAAAL